MSDARGRLPVRHPGRDGRRCRRHLDRYRPASPRVPREANSVVEIGEVRTLFRMPDLFSLALGGGSIVSPDPLAVGPHSVGYRLTEAALVFGGRTITATDCAVAAGIADIGDKALAKMPPTLAAAVLD